MQFLYRTRSLSLSNDGSLQSETATASSFFLSSFAASARTQMDDKPAAIEMLFGSIAALVGAVANTVVPVHSRLSSHLISDRLRPFLSLLIEDLIRFHSHCTILLLPAVLDVNTSHYLLHQRHQEGGGEWWRGGILTSGKLQIIVSQFASVKWDRGKRVNVPPAPPSTTRVCIYSRLYPGAGWLGIITNSSCRDKRRDEWHTVARGECLWRVASGESINIKYASFAAFLYPACCLNDCEEKTAEDSPW